MATNDGIRRGDAARTGDLEAKPKQKRGATTDDGPAGMPMADRHSDYDAETMIAEGDAQIEGMSIVDEDDPSLGLTNHGDQPPEDWAANTEESHNPPGRLTTDHMTDRSSTLKPKK